MAALLEQHLKRIQLEHGRCDFDAKSFDSVERSVNIGGVDQHRIGEAEALDTVGDLADLAGGMGSGIAGIGGERFHRAHLYYRLV